MAKKLSATPELIDKIELLLIEGKTLSDASKECGLSRFQLYRAEQADGKVKQRIREALASGAQYLIEEAVAKAQNATTRDQALIARIGVEAARARAELLAPSRYGKQASLLPSLPSGAEGMLMVRWMTGEPQPAPQMAIEDQSDAA